MKSVTRALAICAVVVAATTAGSATAAETKGRAVTIRVVDQFGAAIPNARVRVPGTEGKTLVNRNGEWTESLLYTIEGDEFAFKRGEHLVFNVSAPEYHARAVKYKVRGRMNYVEVPLRPMPEPTAPLKDKEVQDELVRWFSRTTVKEPPREGRMGDDGEAPKEDAPPTEDKPDDKDQDEAGGNR